MLLYLDDSKADAELAQALLQEAGIACELTRVETRAEFAARAHWRRQRTGEPGPPLG